MRSIKWPDMFNSNSTNVWKSDEYLSSTKQNVKLLLLSERGELFGDPYFGLLLKHYMYNQNNYILKDMIIDMIYTQIAIFIPQVHIERKDVHIVQEKEKGKLYASFSGINQIDYKPNTYNLLLYDDSKNLK